jgi:hypothetical protein
VSPFVTITRTHLTLEGASLFTGQKTSVVGKERMGLQSKKQSINEMHCCPSCDSSLLQPANWNEQGDGHWNVELRCPECEWWGLDSYSQDEVDQYNQELDRGGQALIEDLCALTRANMKEEADRFSAALATDGILPEDFGDGPA